MNKKLTLLLDETIINLAKNYAERRKETLSGIVERYFKYITTNKPATKKEKISREIESLIGIIRIPDNIDIKKEYRQRRAGKVLNE